MKNAVARVVFVLTVVLTVVSNAQHADSEPAHSTGRSVSTPDAHPAVSDDAMWAGPMVIIVLGLFLAAAVVGPIIRAEMPDEPPPDHAHDEPSGHNHAHGHGH